MLYINDNCIKYTALGVAFCICGLIILESFEGDKKAPDHIHPSSTINMILPTSSVNSGTSGTSLSVNFI